MNPSLCALAIVGIVSIAFALLAKMFLPVSQELITKISVLIVSLFPVVRDSLDGRTPGLKTVASFESYGKGRTWVILSAALLIVAAMLIVESVSSLFAAIYSTEIPYDTIRFTSTEILKAVLYFPALFLIGRYMASTSRIVSWFDPFLVSLIATGLLFGVHLQDSFFDGHRDVYSLFYGFCEKLPLMLGGFFFGRNMRFANYLNYLLTRIPLDTRHTIVQLAEEEAIGTAALEPVKSGK